MKTLLKLFVALGLSLGLLENAYADLNDGLMAYYPFNGNANDASGNENHGTVHGAVLTTDGPGNVNSAYSFNGAGDYIEIPILFSGSQGPLTISAWVSQTETEGCASIYGEFTYGDTQTNRTRNWLCLHGANGGKFNFFQSGSSTEPARISADLGKHKNHWVHIVFIKNNDVIYGYKNGILSGSASHADTYSGLAPEFASIGSRLYPGDINLYSLAGKIDEVRIYNRVLSDMEIQQLLYSTDTGSTQTGIDKVIANPATYGLHIPAELADAEQTGIKKVTNNPNNYSLYTAAQLAAAEQVGIKKV
ncbi:MAG: LamG domain-containing protein, partial [Gammaproteobacteria bacterium]|nr:LamG domain-containing protein [Gammaproteobacteria bacterium]